MKLTPARLTVLMLFVIAGLVVAYIAKSLLARETKPPVIATRNIPVPLNDLEPGTIITDKHIGLSPMVVSSLTPDMLVSNRVIVGRVVKEKLKANEPIRTTQLYEPDAQPPLTVDPGYRAVTLEMLGAHGIVDGLIKPGERVDVLLTVTDSSADERLEGGLTLTLMRAVRVLRINRSMQQQAVSRDFNTVTLELTPAQANMVQLARSRGQITMVANPQGQPVPPEVGAADERITWEQILRLPPKAKAEAPKPFTASIYRGTRRRVSNFWSDGSITEGDSSNRSGAADAPSAAGRSSPPTPATAPAAPASPATDDTMPADPAPSDSASPADRSDLPGDTLPEDISSPSDADAPDAGDLPDVPGDSAGDFGAGPSARNRSVRPTGNAVRRTGSAARRSR